MKRLFIVGAPRSGTTWLQILFAQHSQIVTSSETHIYTQYLNLLVERWEHEKKRKACGHKVSGLTEIVDHPDFLDATRLFANRIYTTISDRRPEASIVLDKTPENLLHTRHILEHFPEAYFIHIVRDPRAVVASFKTAAQGWWSWTQSGPISIINRWKADVLAGRAIQKHTSRYLEVCYEDLISRGPALLVEIFDFIEEPLSFAECYDIYERCSLSKLQNINDNDLVQPWDISSEPDNFFRKGDPESWKNELSSYEQFAVQLELSNFEDRNISTDQHIRHISPNNFRYNFSKLLIRIINLLIKVARGIEWRLVRHLDHL